MPIENVTIFFTYDCNIRCLHCFFEAGAIKYTITTEQVLRILDQLNDMRVPTVTFTGGEPFWREDFISILDYASKKHFSTVVNTNATLIGRELAQRLSGYNLSAVYVSLDGVNGETHDALCGKGSFAKTMNGIAELLRAGLPVRLSTALHKRVLPQLPAMYELVTSMGVSSWGVNTLLPVGRAEWHPEIFATPDEIVSGLSALAKVVRDGEKGVKITGYTFSILTGRLSPSPPPCSYVYETDLKVQPNERGEVIVKPGLMVGKPEYMLGKSTVKDILNSDEVRVHREILRGAPSAETCSTCRLSYMCVLSPYSPFKDLTPMPDETEHEPGHGLRFIERRAHSGSYKEEAAIPAVDKISAGHRTKLELRSVARGLGVPGSPLKIPHQKLSIVR